MKSPKQKGNRYEQVIAKMYQRKLDKFAKRMPTSGAMEYYKADILKSKYDGWHDECKHQEKISIYKWWEQAKAGCGMSKPVLHFRSNHKDSLTVIRTEDYFDMREELQDWRNQYDK